MVGLPRHFLLYRKSNCYWRSNSILFRTPKRLSFAAQQLVEFVALSVSRESLDELAVQFQLRFFPSPQTHDVPISGIRQDKHQVRGRPNEKTVQQ